MHNESVRKGGKCIRCGKHLHNPNSLEVGMGTICRMKVKMADQEEHRGQGDLFINNADFVYHSNEKFVEIVDLDLGNKSVTNDMAYVLSAIAEREHSLVQAFYENRKIIYKDSTGRWDGVRCSFNIDGRINEIMFYPIQHKEPLREHDLRTKDTDRGY